MPETINLASLAKKISYDKALHQTLEKKSHLVKTLLIAPEVYAIEPTLPKSVIDAVRMYHDPSHQKTIKDWIETSKDKNATDKYGNTLLHYAADKPSIGLVNWFIKKGLNIDALNLNGESPLLVAIRQAAQHKFFHPQRQPQKTQSYLKERDKFIQVIRAFIQNKAKLAVRGGYLNTPKTALRTAMFENDIDLMRLLVHEAKADVDQMTKGQTPLLSAVFTQNVDAIKFLVEAKASVDKDSDGVTPLQAAEFAKNNEIIKLLEGLNEAGEAASPVSCPHP
jgi:hypothetical protein